MPRRKGQGISPTKRLPNKDGGTQSRKKTADNNEDPGGGTIREQLQEAKAEDSTDVNNSKYLHKKFKKMATASPVRIPDATTLNSEENLPTQVIINGQGKPQKESVQCEIKPSLPVVSPQKETYDLSISSGKNNSASKVKVVDCVSSHGPVVVAPTQGRYVCPYCKLACAKPSVLQKHIRAHTNERPYPCIPCGFAFKTKSNLYKHCRSRAHALKMEEHGTKFTYPLEETSDMEEEDDENNSNNTPPPPSSFVGVNTIVPVSMSASQLNTSVSLPNVVQGILENPERRPIYKPKFHKAAMYKEEEEILPLLTKKGPNLSLKIPSPNVPSFSSVGSVLVKPPASPSSEFLQRHISKIISENQAIVETMDLWPKKHSRHKEKEGSPASPLSASSSPGLDPSVWPKKFFQRPISLNESTEERIKAHHAAQSKLALALLRPTLPVSPRVLDCPPPITPEPTVYSQQPLNLTTSHIVKNDIGYLQRKGSFSEEYGSIHTKQGAILKDQNFLNNRTHSSKERMDDLLSENQQKHMDKAYHLQNPEGSIIKDLLLKERAAASAAGLSMQGFQDMVDGDLVGTLSHLQSQEEYHGSQNAQYVCQLCKIPYRNAENLEIHQLYYCKGEGIKPLSSPQRSPNSRYMTSNREVLEESVSSTKVKMQSSKGKARLDLKISPVKEGSKICQPFPSPGPLLGNTPLVDSYYYGKRDDDDFGRSYKKQRLDSETSSRSSPNSLHEVRSISSPFAAMSTGGTTTLRSLEELSKCPMRPNSLQMFGGEVSILDGAGETKTMRIEPRGKSPSATEYLNLPNVHQSGMISNTDCINSSGNSSPQIVVTIARSGLNSGGTIVQVPLKANAASNIVKPPRSSGGCVNSRSVPSPMTLSPLLKTSRHSLSSPPNTPFSTATYFSQNTSTITNSYPDTPKLMPNINTPNLAVPGIPAPIMTHHLPFMPFTSILPDGTLLNPLTNITAFNPLTLPPHSSILHANLLNLSSKDHMKSPADSYNTGGVVSILHGGKVIPYVQGMPGPQTLLVTSPSLGARKTLSPKPLDLASPSKEQLPSFKSGSPHNTNHQQIHISKSKVPKSSNYTSPTVIQSSHRKLPLNESSFLRDLTSKLSTEKSTLPVQQPKLQPIIPSIKVDNVSPDSDSSIEEIKRPTTQTIRKPQKRSELVNRAAVKESVKDSEVESMEVEKDSVDCGPNRPKFLRPTSLPLKPGTFVPKQHHSSGLTPIGGNVLPLVSPETPRPKKSYGQLYLNGHSYTYLALKCSTRPFYCTLNRPQPMYVPQSPEHSKISMYSNWKVCSEADPNPLGLDPGKAMAFYDSRLHREVTYTVANPSEKLPMTLTHSSYWVGKSSSQYRTSIASKYNSEEGSRSEQREGANEGLENLTLGEAVPKRVRIFDGGFESNEEYIYVRGRGRGRYVCEECGIRCKKPSMLKKHIRTHTDVRPFTCKHCSFSFKTKGNLTKHMKSKAHYKKCVELGIVPVPTIVDDSYIDEECLARQQALRASRDGNGETDSDENEEEDDDEEDEEDDEEGEEGDDEGRLEREAACSLLSLSESTRFNTSSSHRYLSLGLIPLPSIVSRPTTYPYTLTFSVPKPNQQVTEPQTPTLTNLTAQTEREKVSRNTGLALELREDNIGKVLNTLNRRNSSVLIPPTGEKNRCYFPSRRTPTLMKSLSEKSWSDEDSDGFEDDNSEGLSDDTDMSDSEFKSEQNYEGNAVKGHRYEKDSEKSKEFEKDFVQPKELKEDQNMTKNLCNSLPEEHMKSLKELRESYELSVGIKTKDEIIEMDTSELNSTGPMDLSSKSMSLTRKLSIILPCVAPSNGTRTPTTPISDILTPVSEPAVLASLCSSMERFPVAQTLPAKLAVDIKETTMLQAYLTEKALQDVRMKQHLHRHNQGYTVAQSLIKANEAWGRSLKKDNREEKQQGHEEAKYKTPPSNETSEMTVSVFPVLKELQVNDKESIKTTEGSAKDQNKTDGSKSTEKNKETLHEMQRYSAPKSLESLKVGLDMSSNLKEVENNAIEITDSSISVKTRDSLNSENSMEKVVASMDTLKMKDKTVKNQTSVSMACVSMAGNMVRNVVVGGIGFAGHQPPSSPPSNKKSPSPGKPKAEFMPPSIGPSSSYCSVMEDGRSVCVICNKIFSKPSQLRLHVNIHYFERPFRCESCAVSFRTKGHLQKHERSVSHQNKVSMNSTFGTATMTNPRPFKCDDCKIAFRIHGHLAKHLRSKMHIMKLECVGKLPFGTYAEMEREGVSLNDIDTSDCDNSLESLQILAQKLYEKDPSKLGQWDGERGELLNPNPPLSEAESSSDEGEPCPSPPTRSPTSPLRHPEFVPQVELNSTKNTDLKSEHISRRPVYTTTPNTRVNSYADEHKHLAIQSLAMMASREQLYTSTKDAGGSEKERRVVDTTRKRKSVDDLDYTDTSDGDNEASSNLKYTCRICHLEFSTIASLHVHSFVEHDSSSTEDEKIPSKSPGAPSSLPTSVRKASIPCEDFVANRNAIINDASKQSVKKVKSNESSSKQDISEHLLQSSNPSRTLLASDSICSTLEDTDSLRSESVQEMNNSARLIGGKHNRNE